MPNDARLGLVVGVILVIAAAVLTFRKDDQARLAGNVQMPASAGGGKVKPGAAQTASGELIVVPGRSHTVKEGETLFSLALRYYGDPNRSSFLFHANQDRVRAPDHVPVGTVLIIPDLPRELAAGQQRP